MRIVGGAVFALFSSPCGGGGLIAGGTADPPEAFSLPAGDEVLLTSESPSARLRFQMVLGNNPSAGCMSGESSTLDLVLESYEASVVSVELNDCADAVWREPTEVYGAHAVDDPVRSFDVEPFAGCPGGANRACATSLCADVRLVDPADVLLSGTLHLCARDLTVEVTAEEIPDEDHR